jgi:hypothetical protein
MSIQQSHFGKGGQGLMEVSPDSGKVNEELQSTSPRGFL